MRSRIQLQKHARVLASDSHEIGSLDRVVLNPETKVVTHIVIRTSTLLRKEDKILPLDLVDETTEDRIILRAGSGDADAFPLFEEQEIVEEQDRTSEVSSAHDAPSIFLGYPTHGTSFVPASEDQTMTQEVQNIPE